MNEQVLYNPCTTHGYNYDWRCDECCDQMWAEIETARGLNDTFTFLRTLDTEPATPDYHLFAQ